MYVRFWIIYLLSNSYTSWFVFASAITIIFYYMLKHVLINLPWSRIIYIWTLLMMNDDTFCKPTLTSSKQYFYHCSFSPRMHFWVCNFYFLCLLFGIFEVGEYLSLFFFFIFLFNVFEDIKKKKISEPEYLTFVSQIHMTSKYT